jgi:hypothetical protein
MKNQTKEKDICMNIAFKPYHLYIEWSHFKVKGFAIFFNI